jgi:hypothetical protein
MARSRSVRTALAALSVLLAGCAPEFDKVSELQTLRVLAVQKEKPYARPGDTVNLSILWRDRSEKAREAPRPVQVVWLTGCENPPADLFFGCFAPRVLFTAGESEQCHSPDPPGPGLTACDNKIQITLSPTIADRPPSSDPTQPPYGLTYVFFAVCAGTIKDIATERANERDFPFGCFDNDGNRLGSDDFVAGYTSLYAYKDPLIADTNENPPVTGFIFKDRRVPVFCTDNLPVVPGEDPPPSCLNLPEGWKDTNNLRCSDTPPTGPEDMRIEVPCVPPCEDDGDEACPSHEFRPELGKPLADFPEPDAVSNLTRGRNIREQMWINYYAEKGGVESEVRLLNDAFAGVNEDFGTEFWAPKEEGPTVIWAVVHDNRGGMSWVGMPIWVKTPEATP